MIYGFEATVLAVSFAAVLAGTLVQRLAGQGLGMLAAPVIALVAPEVLPAALLFLGIAVGIGSVSVDPKAIALPELPPGFAGRALGAVIAASLAARLPAPEAIGPIIAGMVYLGIGLSLIGVRVAITSVSLFSAGTVAGLMATLTGVGAPPMALLYQHETQRRSTAMQNTFFFWGMVVSVLALGWYGLLTVNALVFAGLMLPAVGFGLLVARPLSARVARAAIRPWALGLAALAATTLLIRQL
ncbi:TSUP family transporter [Tropicimonas sp. S265A]|uniref:TSUP family transporter n=1 Tax=Tropicimonas sp. S265A TaxID=3415134 RepID=UPI003C7DA5C5